MRAKAKLLLVALAAMMLTLITQPTLAFYSTSGKAENVVTSGSITLKIHEKTADGSEFPAEGIYVIPGDIVSKEVTIENVCAHPFYLRLQIISGISGSTLPYEECMELDLNLTDWIEKDGYFYYKEPLQPGASTEPIFTEVEIVGSKVDTSYIGSILQLTVSAQAVQTEHNPADAPWDASGWPAPN